MGNNGNGYGQRAGDDGGGMPADVRALLELGGEQVVSDPIAHDDGSVSIFFGKDVQRVHVTPLHPIDPTHVNHAETVIEPASFAAYITAFKTKDAICRASLGGNRITCVLDYFGQARTGEGEAARENALWAPCTHTVTLLCPYDGDYAKWRKQFGEPLNQAALSDFLEDMMHTIYEPVGATILEAINDLRLDRSVKLKSRRDTRTGTVAFEYSDEQGAGEMALPDTIVLAVPIFQGGPTTQLPVKLRYRPNGGKPLFSLSVPGLAAIETAAFRSIGDKVGADTGTPVFYVA